MKFMIPRRQQRWKGDAFLIEIICVLTLLNVGKISFVVAAFSNPVNACAKLEMPLSLAVLGSKTLDIMAGRRMK